MNVSIKLPWLDDRFIMTDLDLKDEAKRFEAIGAIAKVPAGTSPFRAIISGSKGLVYVVQDSTGTKLHYATKCDDVSDTDVARLWDQSVGEAIDCPPVVATQWIKAAANMRRLAKLESLPGLAGLSQNPLEWRVPTKKRGPRQLTLEIEASQVR